MSLLFLPSELRFLKRMWDRAPTPRCSLSELVTLPQTMLPSFVRESVVAFRYMQLLGMLDWPRFPDRPDQRFSPTEPPSKPFDAYPTKRQPATPT